MIDNIEYFKIMFITELFVISHNNIVTVADGPSSSKLCTNRKIDIFNGNNDRRCISEWAIYMVSENSYHEDLRALGFVPEFTRRQCYPGLLGVEIPARTC